MSGVAITASAGAVSFGAASTTTATGGAIDVSAGTTLTQKAGGAITAAGGDWFAEPPGLDHYNVAGKYQWFLPGTNPSTPQPPLPAGVKVTALTRITARPTQDATAAQAWGMRWSCEL